MSGDDGDEARRRRREKDAEGARLRRAARRREREAAWAATAATAGNVVAVVPPPSAMLSNHLVRLDAFLARLADDEGTPLAERCRVFCSAVGAMSKACESHEFRARLDDIERRLAGRPRIA